MNGRTTPDCSQFNSSSDQTAARGEDGDRFKTASVSGLTDAALLLENKTAVPFENGDQLLQLWQNFGRTIAWKTREETRASLSQLLRHHGIVHIVSSSPLCAVVFDVCAHCCCFGVALVELPCLLLKARTAQLSSEPCPTNHAGNRCREGNEENGGEQREKGSNRETYEKWH